MIRMSSTPIEALWKLISWLLAVTGRLLAGVIGLVLLVLGAALSMTVIGAVIGVPLCILGILLLVRCIF